MKRAAFLALAASMLVSCEPSTEPLTPAPSALTSSSAQTTFSGQATVLRAQVLNLPLIVLGNAGPLPESGGSESSTLLAVSVPSEQTGGVLGVSAEVGHTATVGQGKKSRSEASVAEVSMVVAGNAIEAAFLRSQAEATCDGAGGASASGGSEIAHLKIAGQDVTVSGEPNQTINLPNGKVIINEQSRSGSGNQADITVNALHVIIFNPLGEPPVADVVISSAHADISCASCTDRGDDFTTGGGWITTASGTKANLAVAGGIKNGAFWGHLTYIDHGGSKVKGTGVTAYRMVDATTRHIEGTAEIDGVAGYTYAVDVADNGEPGRDDTFSISLSNGYSAGGKLAGGNIQLHLRPSPCP
jgi:hypothetical protein